MTQKQEKVFVQDTIVITLDPKTKARYWSCFQWRAGAKVDN